MSKRITLPSGLKEDISPAYDMSDKEFKGVIKEALYQNFENLSLDILKLDLQTIINKRKEYLDSKRNIQKRKAEIFKSLKF